jgi:hypothetical protein
LNRIPSIQEAKDSPVIQDILTVLNDELSPFFSVGCEKSYNYGGSDHWAKGYIEFAYNDRKLIADAGHYFSLFFHFNSGAAQYVNEHQIQYWWDLQPALFKAVNSAGFSCCIWITTGRFSSPQEARNEWESAVSMLSDYFRSVKTPNATSPIY